MPHAKKFCLNHPERAAEAWSLCRPCYRKHLKENGPNQERLKLIELRRERSINFWTNLQTQYGLGPEEYNRMFTEQKGLCAACGTDGKLVVDHCHETGKVRGLVCHRCNHIAGGIEDHRYHGVLEYLKRHARPQ